MEVGEITVEEELAMFKKRIQHYLAQFPTPDQSTSEAQNVEIEEISSEIDILVEHFISKANEKLYVASEAASCAADLLLHLGKRNEGLDILARMIGFCIDAEDYEEALAILSKTEALCLVEGYYEEALENGDFDTRLACAWWRVFLDNLNVHYYTDLKAAEDSKEALQLCLAFADENRSKFRNLIFVDSVKKKVAYHLGIVLHVLCDFRGAIQNLMVAEHDDRFPQEEVCFNLGYAYQKAASNHPTNSEDTPTKTFEVAASYYMQSFKLCRAQRNIPLAFRAANAAGWVLFRIKDFGQASETFKMAALLAKEVEDQFAESNFWCYCGQMMFTEDKHEEALNCFATSLEVALQTIDVGKEALVEKAVTWTKNTSLKYTSNIIEGISEGFESRMKCVNPAKTSSSHSPNILVERRAEAMLQLGVAKYILRQYDQGIELLPKAMAILDGIDSAASNQLRWNIMFLLAGMYLECKNWTKSANLFKRCETMFEHPWKKIECCRRKAFALYRSNNPEGSLSALFDGIKRYEDQQNSLPNDFAGLLSDFGIGLYHCGRIDEAISYLKKACKIWDETEAYERIEVPQAYMTMFEALILKHEHWQAFQLVEWVESILRQYHQGEDEILLRWKALQGSRYMLIADFSHATKYLETSLREAKEKGCWDLEITILGNLARAYRGLKNYDAALEKYEEEEELLKRSTGHDYVLLKGQLTINQAEAYMQKGHVVGNKDQKGFYEKALETYKNAIEHLVCHPLGRDDLLAKAYVGQATVLHNLGNVAEAGEIAEKALKLVHKDKILIAKLNYHFAHKLDEEGEIDKAIDKARIAAICFADVQMKLQDLESAWVTFFGYEMKYMFILLQNLCIKKNDYTMALLWAERGRMRLFQFKVGEYQNNEHDQACENFPSTSSSSSTVNPLTLESQSIEPHAEMITDDLHHLHLTIEHILGEGSCVSMKASESHNYLVKKGGTSVEFEGIPNYIRCESDHEPSCLKREVSERVGGPNKTLANHCGNKQENQESNPRKLGEVVSCKGDNVEVTDDPLWFDKDDKRATNLIFETLEMCGEGSVIIEYMFAEAHQSLITYVLKRDFECPVRCHKTNMQEFFQRKEVTKIKVKSLRMLVSSTLTAIKKKQDKGLSCLQILHTLLLAPIIEYIVDCSRIVFVPHEILNRVPFAALHNGKTYLIEEKIISTTPSIRSLNRCFVKQNIYQDACKNGALKDVLIAGNPKPMGLNMDQLPGAAQEAEEVAKLLGVEAITGENMTKEVVVKGLGNARLSMIGTHGVAGGAYSHGALVLRAATIESNPPTSITASTSNTRAGNVLSIIRVGSPEFLPGINFDKVMKEATEVITAEEISTLPTGIPAGLVVLSACETGEGEVTSEGLLGLGRAVLQAGASAVVVSYWKVDDFSTKELMTGLFKALVKEGKTVAESLQSTMVSMLQDKHYKLPYHWASFVVFGSPFITVLESKRSPMYNNHNHSSVGFVEP